VRGCGIHQKREAAGARRSASDAICMSCPGGTNTTRSSCCSTPATRPPAKPPAAPTATIRRNRDVNESKENNVHSTATSSSIRWVLGHGDPDPVRRNATLTAQEMGLIGHELEKRSSSTTEISLSWGQGDESRKEGSAGFPLDLPCRRALRVRPSCAGDTAMR